MAEAARAQVRCPFCTKMADPEKVPGEGDIICVQCGLNLLTGQHIQQPAGMREIAPRRRVPVWVYAALPALLLSGAAAVAVVYFLTKDPVQEAIALARTGNTIEAFALMDAHIEKQPDDTRARMLRGKLRWQSQDFARAAADFGAVLEREPRNADAAALAMLSVSRIPGSEAAAQQTAMYQRVLEAQPDNTAAQRMLALTHGAAGRHDDQIAAMERLGAQASSDAFLLQMRGAALALLGRRSEAEMSFAEAAQAGDTGGMAKLAQGLLASMNGDDAKAAEALAQVSGGGPEVQALANTRLGLLRMAKGEYESALALLRKALDLGAGADAQFYHALCLRQLRLNDEARTSLTQIRDARGANAGKAALELAVMSLEAGDPDAAEENLRQAAAAGESSARMQTVQGRVYLARGQEVEAQQTFRQAIQNDKTYAPAHLENGLLYVKRGQTQEGVLSLEEYLNLAGETLSGGVPEVRLLVSQLKQTARGAGATGEATQ